MKKRYILLTLFLVLFTFVLTGCGNSELYYKDHKYLNFRETLDAEKMEIENKNYKETDDQAVIYLFRGQGCGFCRAFITYLNSISTEYGDKFKVVSFEVWNDAVNNELMKVVANFTGEAAGGVPYIVIGEKVFPGYLADWNNDIKAAIDTEYKNNNKNDVFKRMQKGEGFSIDSELVTQIVIALLSVCVVIFVVKSENKKLLQALENAKYTKKGSK